MKLYSLTTPSHDVFKNDWFLPSLEDDFELVFESHDQDCTSGTFMEYGWNETMLHKVNLILRAIHENWDSIFIHADVDIQFFQTIESTVLRCLQGKDIVFQRATPNGGVCAGFFACRSNDRTLKLWEDVKSKLRGQGEKNDQDILNDLLFESELLSVRLRQSAYNRLNEVLPLHNFWLLNLSKIRNPYGVVWDYLPTEFFCAGMRTGMIWSPGTELKIPDSIALHHANWTIGLDNKRALLEYVKTLT
jgi:hypothetical protein